MRLVSRARVVVLALVLFAGAAQLGCPPICWTEYPNSSEAPKGRVDIEVLDRAGTVVEEPSFELDGVATQAGDCRTTRGCDGWSFVLSGHHTITVSARGYVPQTFEVDVEEGDCDYCGCVHGDWLAKHIQLAKVVPSQPANDDCTGPIRYSVKGPLDSVLIHGSTLMAANDFPHVDCFAQPLDCPDVVYALTLEAPAQICIEPDSASISCFLTAVCGSGTGLRCFGGSLATAACATEALPAGTYYLVVGGATATGGLIGGSTFVLNVYAR
jgi:hypothetical protein